MKTNKNKGSALVVWLVIVSLLGLGGAYELHKSTEKNTSKATVATVSEVAAAKQVSDALAVANAKADAAQAALKAANDAKTSAIAGNAEGALIAVQSDPNPSLQSKIAEVMIDNVLDVSGPATPAQVARFTKLVQQYADANAALVAENANLRNVHLVDTAAVAQLKVENAQVKGNQALAEQAASTANAARDVAVKQTVIANGVAESSAKQIEIVHISFEERIKAFVLANLLFVIGGAIVLFVVLPILAMAFPTIAPAIKSLTTFVLGLWHKLADKAVAEAKALAAAAESKLAAEVAAHTATKAALAGSQATTLAVATTPTVADNLVASMATPAVKAAAPVAVAPSSTSTPSPS
jgi:hypothetical protein